MKHVIFSLTIIGYRIFSSLISYILQDVGFAGLENT